MSVSKKLAQARAELRKVEIKKTGFNSHHKYKYFQLSDLIGPISNVMDDAGLVGIFTTYPLKTSGGDFLKTFVERELDESKNPIDRKQKKEDRIRKEKIERVEYEVRLKIFDYEKPEQFLEFSVPFERADTTGGDDAQNLGASITYIRKYLWMIAFEIEEHDELDDTMGSEKSLKAEVKETIAEVEGIDWENPEPKPMPKPRVSTPEMSAKEILAPIIAKKYGGNFANFKQWLGNAGYPTEMSKISVDLALEIEAAQKWGIK